jgi:outer membrane protein OmpA-like peptidoglycan-associated protein
MAYFISTPPRIGRSQGASIFWGLISVCFAAGACFYFWKNTENERYADQWHDQVLQLQEANDALQAEKTHLQASMAEAESQTKAREDLVQEKETELATEEMRIEGLGRQSATIAAQNQAQVAMVKKFNDAIRKLGGATPPDVVERAGRPVLRLPNAELFAPGGTALLPEGKALLNQLAQAIVGQMDTFELRVVCYTDTDAEAAPGAAKKEANDPQAHAASWDLTAARAAALSRYFRDQTALPFLNVIVTARGDAEPIAANAGGESARNRRVEITVSPLPVPFHAPDADKSAVAPATTTPPTNPAPAATAPTVADKKKKPEKTPTPAH